MKLNLGCSDRHIDGFLCVDIAPPECAVCDQIVHYRVVDLGLIWPFKTTSIEEVLALDVVEHIPDAFYMKGTPYSFNRSSVYGKIHFMNELHRVLVPGGRATIETPNASVGCGFWQDPTHVNGWCLSTFKYFEHGAFAHQRLSKAYGITAAFKVVSLTQRETNGEHFSEKAWKITAVLEAVK